MDSHTKYLVYQDQFAPLNITYDEAKAHGRVWSARLSTGLFGTPQCPSGNKGPKERNEVVLGLGNSGLQELVKLGFIPCPTCEPNNTDGYVAAEPTVLEEYGIPLEKFADKTIVGYDARRVEYERILPLIGKPPSRFYLPAGLEQGEIDTFKQRMHDMGFAIDSPWYYENGKARQYK